MKKINCKYKTLFIGIITGLANGLFGSGGGTVLVPCLVFWTKIEEHKAHATAIAVILPLTLLSSFFYIRNGLIDVNLTLKVTIGSTIGAIIGSLLLNKISSNCLRKTFGFFMIIAAIRMVF